MIKRNLWLTALFAYLLLLTAGTTAAFAAKPVITGSLSNGVHNSKYEAKLTITGSNESNIFHTNEATLKQFGFTVRKDNTSLTLSSDKLLKPGKVTFKVTAASTDNSKTEKSYAITINGVAPKLLSPTSDDLTEFMASNKKVPVQGAQVTSIEIKTTSASQKVTFTATGLPKGLKLEKSTDGTVNGFGTTSTKITGTPTEGGTFNIKVTASNGTNPAMTKTYKLNIVPKAKFTNTRLNDITFSRDYSMILTTNGIPGYPASAEITAPEILKKQTNASFDLAPVAGNGKQLKLTGVLNAKNMPLALKNKFKSSAKVNETAKIKLYFLSGDKDKLQNTEQEISIPVTFVALKPAILEKSGLQTKLDEKKLSKDSEITSLSTFMFKLTGTPPFTVSPAEPVKDVKLEMSGDDTVKISGQPAESVKNKPVNIVVKNAAGTDSVSLKFNVTNNKPLEFDDNSNTWPDELSGDKVVRKEKINKTLTVKNENNNVEEVNWNKNLPAGVVLSKTGKLTAKLSGMITASVKKGTEYYIEAVDAKNSDRKVKISGDKLATYGTPVITTKSLPDIKIGGTIYNARIAGQNITSWDVQGLPNGTKWYIVSKDPKGNPALNSTVTITLTGSLDTKPNDLNGDTVTINVTGINPAASTDVKLKVRLVQDPPKITTTKLNDFSTSSKTDDKNIIQTEGNPTAMVAYIAAATAKKLDIATDGKSVYIGKTPKGPTGLGFSFDMAKHEGILSIDVSQNNGVYKNLPITFSADNGAKTKTQKILMLNINGGEPYWLSGDLTNGEKQANNTTLTVSTNSKSKVKLDFTVSGDGPFNVTPLSTKINGITASLDKSDGKHPKIIISGDTIQSKDTTSNFPLIVTNKSTNKSSKLNVIVKSYMIPEITTSGKALVKEITAGTNFNLKLAAKGATPLIWAISSDAAITSLDNAGIKFNTTNGAFTGKPTKPTADDNGNYVSFDVPVIVTNAREATSPVKNVTVGVKGSTVALQQTTYTFTRSEDIYGTATLTPRANGTDLSNVKFALYNGTVLPDGISIDKDGGIGGKALAATKGTSMKKISYDNVGTTGVLNVKFVVVDPEPAISDDTSEHTVTASSRKQVAGTSFVIKLTEDTEATGDSKVTWALTNAKSYSKALTVQIKGSSGNGNEATIKYTAKKGATPDTYYIDVKATNSSVPRSPATASIAIVVEPEEDNSDLPDDEPELNGALPDDEPLDGDEVSEDETDAEPEAEVDDDEEPFVYGAPRTETELTAGERSTIEKGGYIIAAVLPEVSVTTEGLYELDPVELAENVPEKAELYWFAFPRNAAPSEDDEIAEFYDETGEETKVVPASRIVSPAAWFDEGVTYAPVIAVKDDNATNAKGSLEGAEAGDTVTEDALKQ